MGVGHGKLKQRKQMSDQVIEILNFITRALEIISAALLMIGFVFATLKWLIGIFKKHLDSASIAYRQALGRVIMIGLEVLVAATILKTVTVDDTIQSISYLAIMVAIRTLIGWTTGLEMTGRWPWQKS